MFVFVLICAEEQSFFVNVVKKKSDSTISNEQESELSLTMGNFGDNRWIISKPIGTS